MREEIIYISFTVKESSDSRPILHFLEYSLFNSITVFYILYTRHFFAQNPINIYTLGIYIYFLLYQEWYLLPLLTDSKPEEDLLNFTFDKMTDDGFFLDIKLLKQPDGKFATSVLINPTDKGVYMNYNAFSPEIYKKINSEDTNF